MYKSLLFLFTSAVPALVLACNDNPSVTTTTTYPEDGSTDAAFTYDGSFDIDAHFVYDAGAADGNADAATLSDSEIIGVMTAVNDGEIAQAQLAVSTSMTASVQSFATAMISAHTASNTQFTQLEQQTSLTAQASATQAQLQAAAQATLTSLQALSGSAFDLAYAQAQVTAHTQVLALLNQTLIPTAQNSALKSLLQSTATVVAQHLQMAQALVATLTDGGAMDAGMGMGMDAGDGASP